MTFLPMAEITPVPAIATGALVARAAGIGAAPGVEISEAVVAEVIRMAWKF